MSQQLQIPFNNSYIKLGERFYTPQQPTPVINPSLFGFNQPLAEKLGLDSTCLRTPEATQVFAGNVIPEGAEPIATVYAGHQFGGWNPQLGDGRAILLGEVIGSDGIRYDIQLKGAGQTPYSRMGDGRSPLGPVLREYIISEAMAALGVPTTRSLAAVTTGEKVLRDTVLPGAILTRVAQSHIRIGTFQYFAVRKDLDALSRLADHVIQRHYPEILTEEGNHYLALLQAVVEKQAVLVAQWQSIGFIHGVMNTDNMLISGETIDYGPCAFMDNYHPEKVYSSIDHGGRYAYRNQPGIAQWNLVWLAESLVDLLHEDRQQAIAEAQEALNSFVGHYETAYQKVMCRKLGFAEPSGAAFAQVISLLELMQHHDLDFTLTFRALADSLVDDLSDSQRVSDFYPLPEEMSKWIEEWQSLVAKTTARISARQLMDESNPVFIPRNHLVEEAIQAATRNGDFDPFHQLLAVLARPFEFKAEQQRYALPPTPDQVVLKTFCGT